MKMGLVHLGVGAFHRAHQAFYTDAVLREFGGDWGICGVSLRSSRVRDALAPNDYDYTLAVKDGPDTQQQTISAIQEILVAPESPAAVIDRLAASCTQVVTLTITEKGYCLNPASGALDFSAPEIVHDLENITQPQSAIGFLVAGLQQRRAHKLKGLTLLSCDNLSGNGSKLQAAVLQFSSRLDEGLAAWIAENCTFPNSMVDRIAPANNDLTTVVTEPFCQWVVEDNFAGPIPAWNKVGAEFVADVKPFEDMKLRLLNASHSTMAYLGCLAGYQTIADVVAEPAFAALVTQLMALEMVPTLQGLGDFDVTAYQAQLLQRFANRGLEHRTSQIAIDGSQKIPQRLLPGLQWQLQQAASIDATMLGLAAWIRYTMGVDEQSVRYPVDDPLAATFATAADTAAGDIQQYMQTVLALESVFPPQLANNETFRAQLLTQLRALQNDGALATVHRGWGAANKMEMVN